MRRDWDIFEILPSGGRQAECSWLRVRGLLGTLAFLSVFCADSRMTVAQPVGPNAVPDVQFEQNLGAVLPLDASFVDSTGRTITLGDCLGENPVVLTLVYYRCPMLCNLVLNGLVRTIRAVPMDLGTDYDIVTISIDPRETPELAAGKRTTYVHKYGRSQAASGWHFLTGSQDAISRVAETVGFQFTYDEKTGQFAHAAGIMVLTPDGRVARYLYGVEYAARDLRLALVEASDRRIGSPVDQLLLLCFHYDPTTGKYGLAIMNVIRGLGAITLLILVFGIVLMLRRERKRAAAVAPSASGNRAVGAPQTSRTS